MLLELAACLLYPEGWEGSGLGEEGDEHSAGLGGPGIMGFQTPS